MKINKQYALLIGVGIFSGIINAVLPLLIPGTDNVFLFAGIWYGIVTGIYFIRTLPIKRKFLCLVGWVISSGASYALGVQTVLPFAGNTYVNPPAMIPGYALGGFVGALVLTVAFHFLFRKLNLVQHIAVVIAGALIPAIWIWSFWRVNGSVDLDLSGLAVLYIAWQGVLTTILGSSFLSEKSKVRQ